MSRGGLLPTVLNGKFCEGVAGKGRYLDEGYDLLIMSRDHKCVHDWLHFSTPEDIDRLIELLEKTKELWRRELERNNQ